MTRAHRDVLHRLLAIRLEVELHRISGDVARHEPMVRAARMADAMRGLVRGPFFRGHDFVFSDDCARRTVWVSIDGRRATSTMGLYFALLNWIAGVEKRTGRLDRLPVEGIDA